MSQLPPNLSPDVVRLRNEGYEVEIRGGHLLIHHVPYVDSGGTVQYGMLASTLKWAGDKLAPPADHIIHFAGGYPYYKDGSPMDGLKHQSKHRALFPGLMVDHSFSNKPKDGYRDYHHKMTRYIEMISNEAKAIDPTVTATTFRVIESTAEESVFNYWDTNSSRAEISCISKKLAGQKIAIAGLGGTGSYVLDLVAKTEVDEIHLFDGDYFAQHNAFRAPGAPSVEQLRQPPKKVEYLGEIYSRMHRGIHLHAEHFAEANIGMLRGMDFVFVCLDHGPSKKLIVEFLEAAGTLFIDVGIGIQVHEGQLLGQIRTTLSTPENRQSLRERVSFADGGDDAYSTNIQIAELNMLNAALAVIKWKKHFEFYQDFKGELNSTYSINVNSLVE